MTLGRIVGTGAELQLWGKGRTSFLPNWAWVSPPLPAKESPADADASRLVEEGDGFDSYWNKALKEHKLPDAGFGVVDGRFLDSPFNRRLKSMMGLWLAKANTLLNTQFGALSPRSRSGLQTYIDILGKRFVLLGEDGVGLDEPLVAAGESFPGEVKSAADDLVRDVTGAPLSALRVLLVPFLIALVAVSLLRR